MNDAKQYSLIKPTINTPFQIDFEWWKEHDNNWRVFLFSCLCQKHQEAFSNQDVNVEVDWVDPETAEVITVDGLQHILMTHCAKEPDFVTGNTTLVDSVFRLLLANGNEPMTPAQLGELLNRPAVTILRTFSGMTIYKGIRPKHSA